MDTFQALDYLQVHLFNYLDKLGLHFNLRLKEVITYLPVHLHGYLDEMARLYNKRPKQVLDPLSYQVKRTALRSQSQVRHIS